MITQVNFGYFIYLIISKYYSILFSSLDEAQNVLGWHLLHDTYIGKLAVFKNPAVNCNRKHKSVAFICWERQHLPQHSTDLFTTLAFNLFVSPKSNSRLRLAALSGRHLLRRWPAETVITSEWAGEEADTELSQSAADIFTEMSWDYNYYKWH